VVSTIRSGTKRVLITMATGTGKTFVSLQIAWKLWNSTWRGDRKPRILYLADRNILVDQPIVREFQPVFGDAIWKVKGRAKTGREIYFALYQALADSGDSVGIFRAYPADYFDLIIVDECHRGSASDESSWRGILEHFAPAAQLARIIRRWVSGARETTVGVEWSVAMSLRALLGPLRRISVG
jgi:type I restriction enzyme R subunit